MRKISAKRPLRQRVIALAVPEHDRPAVARRQFGSSATTQILKVSPCNAAAHAHAFLDHASPLVGSTVASAPREVSLTFTQNLETAFSSVQVTDANGARVAKKKAARGSLPAPLILASVSEAYACA